MIAKQHRAGVTQVADLRVSLRIWSDGRSWLRWPRTFRRTAQHATATWWELDIAWPWGREVSFSELQQEQQSRFKFWKGGGDRKKAWASCMNLWKLWKSHEVQVIGPRSRDNEITICEYYLVSIIFLLIILFNDPSCIFLLCQVPVTRQHFVIGPCSQLEMGLLLVQVSSCRKVDPDALVVWNSALQEVRLVRRTQINRE